jgi:glyceraldehyde-3-phosphate dehydrogenase (NADP+)
MRPLFEEFKSRFVAKVSEIRQGDPLDSATEISCMIDQGNALRVETWVKEAVESGAEILCGGNRRGNYVEPTVITGTDESMKVCCNEIFGPVVVLEPVDSFLEAVTIINSGCFGLQAGVFTDSINEMNIAFNEIEAGGIIINDVPTFRVDHMPYGGIKESGQGREGIRYAMMDMLEPRLMVKNC